MVLARVPLIFHNVEELQLMHKQFVDIGISQESLTKHLVRRGIWATEKLRRRHGYVLSPCAYLVSKAQQEQLHRLAITTFAAVEQLDAALIEYATNAPKNRESQTLLGLANRTTCGLLQPLGARAGIPPVMKVDLVQDASGRYHIVEVDAYNPRGLAFLVLLDDLVAHLALPQYAGVVELAALLNEFAENATYIYSHKERYYGPVFEVFGKVLHEHNVHLNIVADADFALGDTAKNVIIIPDSMNEHPSVRDALIHAYHNENVRTLFPPKAYLGSKGFLPFLRSCDGMDEFIPETRLLSRKHSDMNGMRGHPAVIKQCFSSGMKGVEFSDINPDGFDSYVDEALGHKRPSWILQKQVEQEPLTMRMFDEDGNVIEEDHFLRVTAYITKAGVMGLDITGRPDRMVHGAPDCTQLSAILA